MLAGYDYLLGAAARLQWDAEGIPLAADRTQALALAAPVRGRLQTLVGGFSVAEHAVAQELAPFAAAAAVLDPDPRARECFAVQAGDERRHARWFDRLAGKLLGLDRQAARAVAPAPIRELFESELPATAASLAARAAPAQLGAAVGLYHLLLEGIVFAIGQEALLTLAQEQGLAGVADGVARVQGDERWHVGLGVLALQRLAEHGRARPVEITDAAIRAAGAWGPSIATPERIERALAVHGRRLAVITPPIAEARARAGSAPR
ncbi:MAG TPA: hypothetical protein VFN65_01935 [Solirubrobacteraceae bacterium]|nr:hypothetical protein [Solirubrobacteraceae bacterium]